MQNKYQVAIHFGKSFGRIEYDPAAKTATVILDNPIKRKEVEDYLKQPRIMPHARATLLDLEHLEIKPLDSLETLKLALTNLWETTGVLVDWSRPADDTFRV
ncbi:hypothetical protein AXX12_17170 [Anaerosporomusa subterranea]|jgi:hypothetical protein|uniref:Uncharacterized protein n=1 Tax=Anaerosporomusa subterranea TaxID=1794912 RepID=A0A154BVA7_ANASB|nr:hypothetical protein [Anaerosporomusa subterranea]KYZ77795.1 hypothetical protein AXX12_17170 [Anaerosporomusa subterranea]MDF2500936.1 hypothetical protein [Anaerosporomusa subterranea]